MLIITLGATKASAVPVQFNSAGDLADGFYYDIINVSTGINFNQARAAALGNTYNGLNGRLAGIYSQALITFFNTQFPSTGLGGGTQAYIGGQRNAAGVFEWVDHGSNLRTVTYTNWSPGEPNNFGGNEGVMSIYLAGGNIGRWNDLPDTTRLNYYIVEYSPLSIPIPSSVFLLASGLGGLAFMARVKKKAT